MANEIAWRHDATTETLYFTIRNQSRQMWNGSTWEAYALANWANYDIAMALSEAGSYFYTGTFPAIAGAMIAGWYFVDIYIRAGGSPAVSDTPVVTFYGYWDGTTFDLDPAGTRTGSLVIHSTTIATLTSQTVFTLTDGSPDNDAYNGCTIVIRDATGYTTTKCAGTVKDYGGVLKQITLEADPAVFTMAVGDYVDILPATKSAVLSEAVVNKINEFAVYIADS